MSYAYDQFLASKAYLVKPAGLDEVPPLSPKLFEFQMDIAAWALRRGRCAVWADCGLGKTWIALEWARCIHEHTGGDVLILTPLAVAQQFKAEAAKLGISVAVVREADDVEPGINVINYERLHKLDAAQFVGVVADESSVLKDYTSKTRNALIDTFARTPYRLACTATPSPNDHMELGNHAEFLGVMSRTEMLSTFFVHDGGDTSQWRLKRHATADFWRWVCSWAVNLRKPSDLGYDDAGFDLPPLHTHEHTVECTGDIAKEAGTLFVMEARTLEDQRAARRASIEARVARCAELVAAEPKESWICWCELNDESDALTRSIPGALEIRGSQSVEEKEAGLEAFAAGRARVLVTKPSICAWGLNFQHCARVAFVGIGHSFESWYQAIRRTYRFGQTRPVHCHVIISDAELAVVENLRRKQRDAEAMATEMMANVQEITRAELRASTRTTEAYNPQQEMELPLWLEASRV